MTNQQQRPNRRKVKPKKFTIRMKKKLIVLFLAITVVLTGLIIRIMYIQYVKGATYEKIVLSQQAYDSETIPYRRGDILDAKGTILATSTDVYNLVLDCKVLTSDVGGKQPYLEPTLTALFSCYPQLDQNEIRALVTDSPDSQYNVLLKKISYEEMEKYASLAADTKTNPNLKGVWFEKNYIRTYPYGALASPVIGFTRSDNVGMVGLESYYDEVLSGTNGRRYGYLNSDNDLEKTVREAVNGDTIVTTIDANLQSIVEDKIKEFCDTFQDNHREGAAASNIGVLIMNPQNGEVKAMAQYPTFDLTDPWNLEGTYTEEEIGQMSEEEISDARDRLWTNFCVSSTYEPGSTAKPFTVACGLETGTLKGNETFECDGREVISGHRVNCVNRNGHGTETLRTALMDSCNDALMQMSYRIGAENFCEYQNIFGFGLRTNVDLPGEARTDSLLHHVEDMKTIDLATNSFGQNFNVTMIQMAGAFSSLVNGGNYYQPHMVSKVLDENGNVIRTINPVRIKQTVSEETSAQIKSYLYDTVSEGTGRYAKVAGYSMGGKTGTAQKSVAGAKDAKNYLVSFIGYLPADDPQLVIYAVVDEPNTHDQAHSTYAQNLVREILEEALPYLNIYQDEIPAEGALTPEETDFYTGLNGVRVPATTAPQPENESEKDEESGETEADTQPAEEPQEESS
ncbi:MAG: penicillin-binding protein 2, partial [Lachnospiraceae bacterium]|nr:penicillin-binding protein 2 [bacterium]MDY5518357.1 penicillin-binding protein 2 [Lachnospiraceae bacterium]